jgi:hypothetical protein
MTGRAMTEVAGILRAETVAHLHLRQRLFTIGLVSLLLWKAFF